MMGHDANGVVNGPNSTMVAPNLDSLVTRVEHQAAEADLLCDRLASSLSLLTPLGNRVRDNQQKGPSQPNIAVRLHSAITRLESSMTDLQELQRILNSAVGGDAPVPAGR